MDGGDERWREEEGEKVNEIGKNNALFGQSKNAVGYPFEGNLWELLLVENVEKLLNYHFLLQRQFGENTKNARIKLQLTQPTYPSIARTMNTSTSAGNVDPNKF